LPARTGAVPAELLFEDDFTQGIPGWTAVQPAGAILWLSGPLLWQYDVNTGNVWENSNIYSDAATYSSSRRACMLINDTVAPASNFTFTVRIRAADDDGCGLIWGYENDQNFYRVVFARQAGRIGWPFSSWNVDRMANGDFTDLAGQGVTTEPYTPFTYTGNRFFDVTVGMTNGLFSLTVVDDPTNAVPAVYTLVQNKLLPTRLAAKVGVFTWGQSATIGDGLPSVGVRFYDKSLVPTPLAGTTNPLAPVWTTLTTPRADGTTTMERGAPVWALMLDANGTTSRLREASGTFASGDNVAAHTTDFCATTMVAGDAQNWSNYVFSARCIPSDDDGWGLMVSYQNPTNWYRIAFRRQTGTASVAPATGGVKGGMSIQRCVDGVFSEIMADGTAFPRTPAFVTANTAADVYVAAIGDQLQILVMANPTAANPTAYSYGPFTDTSLSKGMIGLFSWAQQSIDYDFARVQKVAGRGLQVSSPFGNPEPPLGLNDLPAGSSVTASVTNIVYDQPGLRRVLTGWQGAGSVPTSGTNNSVTFTLNNMSLITWTWRTEYMLTVGAQGNGVVVTTNSGWQPAGTVVQVAAVPNVGSIFLGWDGSAISTVATQTFAMSGPRTMTARFAADSDNDGLADSWEIQYFGSLAQTATGDPDFDTASNLVEFQRGSNPNFAETLFVTDGLSSQWTNTQRDPALPGQLYVTDLGSGYRGAWDTGNDFRYGDDSAFVPADNLSATYSSFQSPIVVVRPDVWTNTAWGTNFTATWELSVGDNDGSCFYFRYNNESNWYRITLCGETAGASTWRPMEGISVQSRVNGMFAAVPLTETSNPGFAFYADPSDGTTTLAGTQAGFKKSRVTVNAMNENFEVRVTGWDWISSTFSPSYEWVYTFTETNLANGRIGFGQWGQGSLSGDLSTNGIPIPTGGFVDNIEVKVPAGGATVFSENWETAALFDQFPAGWSNAWPTNHPLAGTWYVTAHGTIVQQSNSGLDTAGSAVVPSGAADGPMLLAPQPPTNNYLLNIGFHPFDNDGIGFVYDFQDTDNYSLVMFREEATYALDVPPGLSVSRKTGGVWTDIVAGDQAFLYRNGTPFEIEFANNNGAYRLLARDSDNPAHTAQWYWTDKPASAGNRFGLAVWAETDAHFTYARAYSLPTTTPYVPSPFRIANITAVPGGNVTLYIEKPEGVSYHVLRATSVAGPYEPVAYYQTGAQYSEAMPADTASFYRLQYAP